METTKWRVIYSLITRRNYNNIILSFRGYNIRFCCLRQRSFGRKEKIIIFVFFRIFAFSSIFFFHYNIDINFTFPIIGNPSSTSFVKFLINCCRDVVFSPGVQVFLNLKGDWWFEHIFTRPILKWNAKYILFCPHCSLSAWLIFVDYNENLYYPYHMLPRMLHIIYIIYHIHHFLS